MIDRDIHLVFVFQAGHYTRMSFLVLIVGGYDERAITLRLHIAEQRFESDH